MMATLAVLTVLVLLFIWWARPISPPPRQHWNRFMVSVPISRLGAIRRRDRAVVAGVGTP